MRKTVTFLAAVALLLPATALAASGPIDIGSKLSLGPIEVAAADDMVRTVTVPLVLANLSTEIVAMDIPLRFGERGDPVDLVDVTYASRVDYFDVKVTNIDNDGKTVIIGLIAMATDPNTPDLAKDKGPIAYLKFEVSANTIDRFTITDTEMERPSHRLMLVSHVWTDGKPEVVWEEPDFEQVVNLSTSAYVPKTYALHQNYPNPFNAGTVIGFDLKEPSQWTLKVYNLLGQAVRTFSSDGNEVGPVNITWNGTDDKGRQVASGVYFYRIQAGSFTDTKKMTLLK
jgi:hypothetical protein